MIPDSRFQINSQFSAALLSEVENGYLLQVTGSTLSQIWNLELGIRTIVGFPLRTPEQSHEPDSDIRFFGMFGNRIYGLF